MAGGFRRSLISPRPGTIEEMEALMRDLREEGAPANAGLEIDNGQVYCGWDDL